MSTNELTTAVKKLKRLKTKADELTAEITAIEDQIKAVMLENDTEEMQVDIFKIRWTKVTSKRFDTTSFKKAMPDLAEKFTKPSESRRFSIA